MSKGDVRIRILCGGHHDVSGPGARSLGRRACQFSLGSLITGLEVAKLENRMKKYFKRVVSRIPKYYLGPVSIAVLQEEPISAPKETS